jgi:transcriptional regulator with XRE-family HTH domain
METRPEQPPEGRLIADAAERLGLSIREAARRTGISYGRWRQIVTGYQNVSPGSYARVHAPAKTLARMARVVNVTAEQMATTGQRADVAELLRGESEPAPPAAASAEGIATAILDTANAMARMNGRPATPEDLFPGDAVEAQWERMVWADEKLPAALRADTISKARIARSEGQPEQNDRSA